MSSSGVSNEILGRERNSMQRDFDLIRHILKDVEKMAPGESVGDAKYHADHPKAVVCEHMRLLREEGFIEANILSDRGTIVSAHISGLTWKGHDFITAAQDDSLWHKAKTSILRPASSYTFDILLQWLKSEAKARLGLPYCKSLSTVEMTHVSHSGSFGRLQHEKEGAVDDETLPIVSGFPFVPTRDALTGRTTDHERHLIARSAYMNALVRNERVLALFEAWTTRYRLRGLVGRWARALDALSAHLGLKHRSQLLRTGAGAPRLVVDESDVAAAQAAVHAAAHLLRQVESATRAFQRAFATVKVEAEVVAFVRDELKLNWTWLAHDLLEAFVAHMYGAVWGTVIVSRWSLAPPQVQERVEFTFIAEHGEPLHDAVERGSSRYPPKRRGSSSRRSRRSLAAGARANGRRASPSTQRGCTAWTLIERRSAKSRRSTTPPST
jgi:Hypothetical protein (DUF2513)